MSDTPPDQTTPNSNETPAGAYAGAPAGAYAGGPGGASPGAPSGAVFPEVASATSGERIAALEAELAELRDRWLRAEAEAQNARNRHRKEMEDARNYAVQKFATDVAEAADNLRRGLDALPAPAPGEAEITGKLRGGFEGVERAFLSMLERHGVKRVDPVGQPFDPAFHQAMSEQPAPAGSEPGTVLQAWTPSWTLNGRLLRPAMVVVAGKPA